MKKTLFVLATVVLVVWCGCSTSNTSEPQRVQTGTMQVMMTDSPAAYDQVNIVVDSVRAHIDISDTTGGWYTLNRTSTTYNLLALVNGANAVIGAAKLPVGYYTQLRLYIGSGSNVVVSGVTKSLNVPSGSQSGLKLNIAETIHEDAVYVLTLDFEANQSIVVSGPPANPNYNLKPVIRVITTAATGTITGMLSPAASLPSLWAYGSADTVSTVADPTGAYKLIGLPAGKYSLFVAPKDAATYRDTTISNVNVTAGGTTTLNITLNHK